LLHSFGVCSALVTNDFDGKLYSVEGNEGGAKKGKPSQPGPPGSMSTEHDSVSTEGSSEGGNDDNLPVTPSAAPTRASKKTHIAGPPNSPAHQEAQEKDTNCCSFCHAQYGTY
jgi:hypothetical protein